MKLFSPESANALIPVLAPLIDELLARRRDLAILLLENDPALRYARNAAAASPELPASRLFGEQKAEIRRIIDRIEAHGCVIKDIDLGLLDFPAMREGRSVYLCWKAGEAAVAFWHGTEENFYKRKSL